MLFTVKRFFTHAISIITAAVMLCGLSVNAALLPDISESSGIGYASLYQEGAFAMSENANLPETQKNSALAPMSLTIRDVILSGLENIAGEISFTGYSITIEELLALYTDIINTNPRLFYVTGGYRYYFIGNRVTRILPYYNDTKDHILQKKIIFSQEVEKALSFIPTDVSDVEKVLAVNDYIVYTTRYDETLTKYSAYDVIVDKIAVCQGYSLAFMLFMDRLGVENRYVSSVSMNHAWNLVKVDGKWYHVDVTWNDPLPDTLGYVSHEYLLLSDTVINDSQHRHYGWDTSLLPAAPDDTYKNYFWTDVTTAIIHNAGLWYYIPRSDGFHHTIKSYDFTSGSVSGIYTITASWLNSNGSTNPLLGKHMGQLVYNTNNAIYKINFNGTCNSKILSEPVTDSTNIYEMDIRGDYVYYRVSTGSSRYGYPYTEKKLLLSVVIKGDVNGDGEINIFDIMAIRDHIFGKAILYDNYLTAADVNKDSSVNIFDIMSIRDYIFGKSILN